MANNALITRPSSPPAALAQYTAQWVDKLQAADLSPDLANYITAWANHTTDPDSPRRLDLIRDKGQAITAFFVTTGKNHRG